MVIKTNRVLFMLGNHSGYHNTEIKHELSIQTNGNKDEQSIVYAGKS